MKNKNGRYSAADKKNTKMEVNAPNLDNSDLVGSLPLITLDITSLGKNIIDGVLVLILILVKGFITLVKILLEHPKVISGIIFIIILCLVKNLPNDRIKALTEFIQSLPTQFHP